MLSGGADADLMLWDAGNGTLRARGRGHAGRVRSLAVSPDGSLCASTGMDDTMRTWTVPGLARHALMPLPGGGWSVTFGPFGSTVAIGGDAFATVADLMPPAGGRPPSDGG